MTVENIEGISQRAKCFKTREDIEGALDKMAAQITDRLADTNPIVLCVMVGGLIPTGHLATRLNFPLQIDYIHVTRYGKSTRGGDLHWLVEPRISMKDRTVLVVEDVLDGGLTLSAIIDFCEKQGAKEVLSAVVVDKEREREPDALESADFTGLTVPNEFIYGFGLDYDHYLRNAFGIYAVDKDDQ